MNLEETTQLYASVLRQLLPTGGYDTSPNTEALAVDVYAHAKLLAQADLDGKRLLRVLEGFPSELLPEFELEYGLPLKCTVNASRTFEERLQILNWVRTSRNVFNRAYLEQLFAIFGVVMIDIVKFKPMQSIAPCNAPVNTEQLRYKVLLELQYPVNADLSCIIENYLPGYLQIEFLAIAKLNAPTNIANSLEQNKIVWTFTADKNAEHTNYYRSSIPFDFSNMPMPVGKTTTNDFIDTTAHTGSKYYIVLSSVRRNEEVFSEVIEILNEVKDEYFDDVDLLIFADANAFPSAAIIDSSSMHKTIIRRGDVSIIADPTNFGLDDGVLFFDGNADRLQVNVDPLLDSDFTYEVFVYPLNNNGGNARIFQVGDLNGTNSFALIRWGNALTFERNGGSWYWMAHVPDIWFINRWYHVVLMRKDDRIYICLNGVVISEFNFDYSILSGDIYVGQSQQQAGTIDAITAYMKSIRFTPNRARYPTTGFATPTEKFPIS